jgi:hypothetical protein
VPDITVEAVRGPGLPLLVGDWGTPNVLIRVTPPTGPAIGLASGSKREYGPGGFELYAQQAGTYTVQIEKYRFEVPMRGQFTRLIFRRATPAQPGGVIAGALVDHLNRLMAQRQIQLSGPTGALSVLTSAQGSFRFEQLPAGSYTLTVADSSLSQVVNHTGQGQVTLALQLPAPPSEWQVNLEPGKGLPLLVGDIGVANAVITITSPGGRAVQVTSGSKPEWGIGGFEVYASELGNYTVQFFGRSFSIPLQGQFTKAIFRKDVGAAEQQVRLVSMLLPRAQAEAILQSKLEVDANTRGVFTIQGV